MISDEQKKEYLDIIIPKFQYAHSQGMKDALEHPTIKKLPLSLTMTLLTAAFAHLIAVELAKITACIREESNRKIVVDGFIDTIRKIYESIWEDIKKDFEEMKIEEAIKESRTAKFVA